MTIGHRWFTQQGNYHEILDARGTWRTFRNGFIIKRKQWLKELTAIVPEAKPQCQLPQPPAQALNGADTAQRRRPYAIPD